MKKNANFFNKFKKTVYFFLFAYYETLNKTRLECDFFFSTYLFKVVAKY